MKSTTTVNNTTIIVAPKPYAARLLSKKNNAMFPAMASKVSNKVRNVFIPFPG